MSYRCIKAIVRGAVQGVGFRPFVYRLASELGLNGWVMNSPEGVLIEAEGQPTPLEKFLSRLESDKPPLAIIQSLESHWIAPAGYKRFEIRHSDDQAAKRTLILPDIATCPECLAEIFDPNNRRYLYPFTNCTNCGPRFSIIESLPYDRANTSMKQFCMCPECEREYHDPADRRFHAQPNACPACGPQLELWDGAGKVTCQRMETLWQSIKAIREGKILAVKGIGGFQLLVDAQNEEAVLRLRQRKHREEKPFALMFPSLAAVEADCIVGKLERELLQLPSAPIALVLRRSAGFASIAPGNPHFGVMLPYSPLHHLLLRNLGFPVVATSGNLSDEPICIDENEALERLRGIADVFLVHNRPVVRPVDDSVVRVIMDREMVIRRARGLAPLPIQTLAANSETLNVLALGAHLKNSVTLSVGGQFFTSQHIGDLETPQALEAFRAVSRDLPGLYEVEPEVIACDMHPEYLSTKQAQASGKPVVEIQHHYAHVAACMGENRLEGPVLGVAWDGTGYGTDGTIWGSEFLAVNTTRGDGHASAPFSRFAHFRNFLLPGGATAIRQPRRAALGLLWEIFGEKIFERGDLFPVQSFSQD
ncbi:MAG TPA: carbamoyltransferase HypF, partial [Verrucomicrobiae bacterium]|nr:carbamoyltransferase HypF [Verrucomicrobiae bacterium]